MRNILKLYFKNLVLGGAAMASLGFGVRVAKADDSAPPRDTIDLTMGLTPDPKKGYELILHEPMAAPIMKVADVERIWQAWEPEEKAKAEKATPEQRHKMIFERYGWAERPDDKSGLPLDYTEDGRGNLVTNCFSCHGGHVAGKTIPGMGNAHIDMTALATDVMRLRKLDAGGDPQSVKDVIGPFNTPLNFHRGVTNAVIFAPMINALRDPSLAKELTANPDMLKHHDMNAPAWWNYKKKDMIYCDAFAPKTHRQLMPFALSPTFSDEKFHSFEPNFVHIEAYISTLQPPKYPFSVDQKVADKGREVFEMTCARCHGTYGPSGKYPNKVVPIKDIGTDPVRLTAITREMREKTNSDWLQYYGAYPVKLESTGYIAPPLDGIWATAPYFHNGSVPTISDVFNVKQRPKIWKRDEDGYDQKKIGLVVEVFDAVPEGLNPRQQRAYYDTTHVGDSAAGHTFPDDELNAEEKIQVMEYLKTL
ncbi:cytochrome c [Candidatus Sumerlaeota bacterium]|nr:cytochrome c [Candidatus Sumerlaeota bacterium]